MFLCNILIQHDLYTKILPNQLVTFWIQSHIKPPCSISATIFALLGKKDWKTEKCDDNKDGAQWSAAGSCYNAPLHLFSPAPFEDDQRISFQHTKKCRWLLEWTSIHAGLLKCHFCASLSFSPEKTLHVQSSELERRCPLIHPAALCRRRVWGGDALPSEENWR